MQVEKSYKVTPEISKEIQAVIEKEKKKYGLIQGVVMETTEDMSVYFED